MTDPVLSVQCAFTTDPAGGTSPAWVDITRYAKKLTITRGRQFELNRIEAGTLDLVLGNTDRRFDPTYTGSPYAPNVLPNRRIRVSATYSGTTYYLFDGYVERWPPQWSLGDDSEIEITAVDAFSLLSTANIVGNFPQELSGARIAAALSASSWPSAISAPGYWTLGTSALGSTAVLSYDLPTTLLDTGRSTIAAVTFAELDNQDALSHILDVCDTEVGYAFMDGQGRPVFHDRWHRLQNNTPIAYISDAQDADATHLLCEDLQPSFDIDHLLNEVRSQRSGGAVQIAIDSTSIGRYFRRTQSDSPLLTNDSDVLNRGKFLVRCFKDPLLRFDSCILQPTVDTDWPLVLGMDIGNPYRVVRTPDVPNGVTPQQVTTDTFLEHIQHQVEPPTFWQTTVMLSHSHRSSQFMLLGSTQLGASQTDSSPTSVLAA